MVVTPPGELLPGRRKVLGTAVVVAAGAATSTMLAGCLPGDDEPEPPDPELLLRARVAEEVRALAAQSLDAARQAGALVGEIAGQVESVTGQMARGQEIVAGVEKLSHEAAQALDAIKATTGVAGEHAERIAETAARQRRQAQALNESIERVATVATRARGETDALAQQAGEAARGQADLEGAIRELGEVTAELQRIARHFDVDA
jgi:methyl-accepting chemotaxis protein